MCNNIPYPHGVMLVVLASYGCFNVRLPLVIVQTFAEFDRVIIKTVFIASPNMFLNIIFAEPLSQSIFIFSFVLRTVFLSTDIKTD